jgi:hypothetical protein
VVVKLIRLTCASSGDDSAAASAAAIDVSSASFVASIRFLTAITVSWQHPLLLAVTSDNQASASAVPPGADVRCVFQKKNYYNRRDTRAG